MSNQTALMIKMIPPYFAFCTTYAAPTIPTIDAKTALTPKPPIDGAKAENISANPPPKRPSTPPIIPKTNSTVLEDYGDSMFSIDSPQFLQNDTLSVFSIPHFLQYTM